MDDKKKYKPLEELDVGDEVYVVEPYGSVKICPIVKVTERETRNPLFYLNERDYGIVRIHKSSMTLSSGHPGRWTYVFSTKEETLEHLKEKIQRIEKYIKLLEDEKIKTKDYHG